MAFSLVPKGENLWVGQFSLFAEDFLTHGISTRFGGVSRPPYDSLNLALQVGDETAAVLENRRRFVTALGLSAATICTPEQVHGSQVYQVKQEDAGRGAFSYAEAIPGTDALMTDVPNLPLFLCYADCTPVLLFDPVHRVVAIAHGGWKGTLQNIAARTVRAMEDSFGTKAAECLAAIGPAIGAECYEVGEETARFFRETYPASFSEVLQQENGHIRLNLALMNRRQLEAEGLLPERIDSAAVCTRCNAQVFYSYRAAGGKTGRIAAVIAIR